MLIAKCVHSAYFVPITKGEFCTRLIVGRQVRVLDTVLGFQADPRDIVLLRHWVRQCADCDMDSASVKRIDRNMLFSGSLSLSGFDILHLFTAAENRHAVIAQHGNEIAAMLANIKCLFQ